VGSRTKSGGLLLPVLLVAGSVLAYQNGLLDDIIGGGVEIIGEGDARVMVAGSVKAHTKQCTAQQMISERRCGDRKVLFVDARRMPFIARNTKLAWESGLPAVLTMNRAKQPVNRQAACGGFLHHYAPPVGSCDEYPMASTDEGGKGARAEEVPGRENLCQGGSYRAQYPADGESFLVAITYPDLIAPSPFAGVDIAKEQGLC
jgi:hypothetical protein